MFFSKEKIGVFLISLFIFLPSFIYVITKATSMAYGIFLACLITLWSLKFRISKNSLNQPFILILSGILLLQMIFLSFNNPSLKEIGSIIFLWILVVSAAAIELFIRRLQPEVLITNLRNLSVLIILLGIFSLFYKFPLLGYEKFSKSIFPFSEPSHYIISTSAILFSLGFFLKSIGKITLILLVIIQAILYPSVIMFSLAIMMMIFYYVRKPGIFIFFALGIGLLVYYLFTHVGEVSYFSDRLNFSEDSSNITTLVYMQGWEDAYKAFIETNGVGLGFQNMGDLEPGKYGKMIFQILGEYKNRKDAGFLAAKVVGELGIVGLAFLIFYLRLFIKSSQALFRFVKNQSYSQDVIIEIFAHSIIVSFFLELFLRGYGYFSPGSLPFLVAFFLVFNQKYQVVYEN